MKKKEKKVIIQHSESLEKFKTDLSEYAFILEQQYKKKVIPQQFKKKKIWYNKLVGNNGNYRTRRKKERKEK